MTKNTEKWAKAQSLEPLHWIDSKENILSGIYQLRIKERSRHIFTNIHENLNIDPSSSRILEIGGGATPLATHANSKNITLVDPLMNFYKETFPEVFAGGATGIEARAEKLPFDEDSFDIIVTRNTLDHVEDVEKCMKEMKRVLKPEGAIYIGMNVFAGPLLIYRIINKDPEHPYTFSEKSFKKLTNRYFATSFEIKNDPINGAHFSENEDQTLWKKLLRNIFIKIENYAIIELYMKNEK